jgi:5-methylcytosine-specific restriction protein A
VANRLPNHRPYHTPPPPDPRPSAALRGYGWRWTKLRLMVLRERPLCEHCGRAATDVDHKVARVKGGDDSFENLQALCASCHAKKTVREDGGLGR